MAGFGTGSVASKHRVIRRFVALIAMMGILCALATAPAARGQNEKKKKKKNEAPKVNNDNANPVVPLTDEQQIDYMLSEYLGAWQLGDTERLHKFYAEDVTVVSGGWTAPVAGWTNFLALYQQQR